MLVKLSIIILVGLFANVHTMSDQELENVKKMVDKELAKRQMDVILANPDKLIAKTAHKTIPPPPTTTTTTATTTENPDIDNFIDNCFDLYGNCQRLVYDFGMNCNEDRMDEMCAKTCLYCGNAINPMINCETTQFGCCDDGLTRKVDPSGSKCPICKDNDPELCKGHSKDCNDVGMAGRWMRTNCKKSCDQCANIAKQGKKVPEVPKCEDDPEQEQYCGSWKASGLCTQIPDLMAAHCAKTCGKC